MLLVTVLEAGMRKEDTDLICKMLNEFTEIGAEPHKR